MKTKKHALRDRTLIERHHADPTDKHRLVQLPYIGLDYECVLIEVQQEYFVENEKNRPLVKMLRFMWLVDHRNKLTKLGRHYMTFYKAKNRQSRPVKRFYLLPMLKRPV